MLQLDSTQQGVEALQGDGLRSLDGLALPPRLAIMRRLSLLAGSWAQQTPSEPLAERVQRVPSGLIALHRAIN